MNIRLAAQSGLADLVLSKNKWVAPFYKSKPYFDSPVNIDLF
jgi:hypothetical protein